jgi:hypothetical protein
MAAVNTIVNVFPEVEQQSLYRVSVIGRLFGRRRFSLANVTSNKSNRFLQCPITLFKFASNFYLHKQFCCCAMNNRLQLLISIKFKFIRYSFNAVMIMTMPNIVRTVSVCIVVGDSDFFFSSCCFYLNFFPVYALLN